MELYNQWKTQIESISSPIEYQSFWDEYLPKEQKIYETILENTNNKVEGTIKELSQKFDVTPVTFIGFIDGINDSLINKIEIEKLDENSNITLQIDFEKLYYNMHNAKAKWLYKLPQWENVLSKDKRKAIKKEYQKEVIVVKEEKIGRNDPCPCGSGKKYKKCCLSK